MYINNWYAADSSFKLDRNHIQPRGTFSAVKFETLSTRLFMSRKSVPCVDLYQANYKPCITTKSVNWEWCKACQLSTFYLCFQLRYHNYDVHVQCAVCNYFWLIMWMALGQCNTCITSLPLIQLLKVECKCIEQTHNFQIKVSLVCRSMIFILADHLIAKVADGVDNDDNDSNDVSQDLEWPLTQNTIVAVEGTECWYRGRRNQYMYNVSGAWHKYTYVSLRVILLWACGDIIHCWLHVQQYTLCVLLTNNHAIKITHAYMHNATFPPTFAQP